MAREIRPLTLDDLPDLSRFLTAGFQAPPNSDFAAPDVLHWKYLETDPESVEPSRALPRSYLARDDSGAIIGHLGLCRTAFLGQALGASVGPISTIHIIDWLGSPQHRAVGTSLMRKAHEGVQTQFGLGVSPSALVVGERIGYELRSLVPVYVRVLRPGYWLRTQEVSRAGRVPRLARDLARTWFTRPSSAPLRLTLSRVATFGSEIEPIVAKAQRHAIMTTRDAPRLNAMLGFPRQQMTGWHLFGDDGGLVGLAVLNVIPKDSGRTRTGKIVDCLLAEPVPALWQAAARALTSELANQGADLALAYASTPWAAEGLSQSGFQSRFSVKFHIRDRSGIIPREAIFHLTPLEGDYAYT
jgi:hypothetical protein